MWEGRGAVGGVGECGLWEGRVGAIVCGGGAEGLGEMAYQVRGARKTALVGNSFDGLVGGNEQGACGVESLA